MQALSSLQISVTPSSVEPGKTVRVTLDAHALQTLATQKDAREAFLSNLHGVNVVYDIDCALCEMHPEELPSAELAELRQNYLTQLGSNQPATPHSMAFDRLYCASFDLFGFLNKAMASAEASPPKSDSSLTGRLGSRLHQVSRAHQSSAHTYADEFFLSATHAVAFATAFPSAVASCSPGVFGQLLEILWPAMSWSQASRPLGEGQDASILVCKASTADLLRLENRAESTLRALLTGSQPAPTFITLFFACVQRHMPLPNSNIDSLVATLMECQRQVDTMVLAQHVDSATKPSSDMPSRIPTTQAPHYRG